MVRGVAQACHLPYNGAVMKAWDYRFLFAACLPLAMAACPVEEVPTETDTPDDSSSGAPMTSTTTTVTESADTTTDDPPMTTMSMESTGNATTATTDPDTGDSGNTTGPVTVCGNNILEGDEACDLNQLNGETCASLGYQGGVLGCLLTCEDYNLLGCFICGNEVIDIAEDCEGGVVPEEVTCQSLGYEAGWVECGADCLYDLSECSICGDGIQSGPEQCDGIDYGGETCNSIGFDGGDLGCNLGQCQFVYSGCFGGQYIQNFEGGMGLPVEFDVGMIDPWTVDGANPINGAASARSGPVAAGGITNMTLIANFAAAGNVSFDYETSCANGIDYLEFRIDNILQGQWTGVGMANNFSMPVAAGMHTLEWRFNRQGFANKGLNAVFVDDITLDNGVPM